MILALSIIAGAFVFFLCLCKGAASADREAERLLHKQARARR